MLFANTQFMIISNSIKSNYSKHYCKMKKVYMFAVALATVGFTACGSGSNEHAQPEAAEEVQEQVEEAAEDAGEAMEDAGEAVEDAAEDVSEEVEETTEEVKEEAHEEHH